MSYNESDVFIFCNLMFFTKDKNKILLFSFSTIFISFILMFHIKKNDTLNFDTIEIELNIIFTVLKKLPNIITNNMSYLTKHLSYTDLLENLD